MNGSSTVKFLLRLRSLNVTLSADGDRLRCSAAAGVMTRELQNELAARKAELLAFLKGSSLATGPRPPAITPISREGELPLSFAQARLWLLERLEPGTAAYNIPSCFRLKGKFHLAAFEQSLTEIVRRHEALRTCFLTMDGRPVQKIASPEPFQVSVVDLQGLPEAARDEEAARLALVDARQPFDLGKAPLMRATLLKLAAEEQVLLLNMHHIAFDGWSFGVFQRELSVLYKAFFQGQASPLPEPPIQYADFAVWQREWLQGEVLQTQLNYWKERLSGSPPVLELPTDRPRPSFQTFNGATVFFVLSPELIERLKTLSRREGVTLFVTLLAAFQVLLLRYTGQEDILVGTPIANRNRAEVEGLIGLFVNTLVMRSDLSGNLSFRELLGRVRETALGAYAHQDLPFEKLVEELKPDRDLGRGPIFQVLFSLQNVPTQPLQLHELEPRRMNADSGTSKFDLSLYAIEGPEGLRCAFEYNTDLFNADRIGRMAGHLLVLLQGIVADPERRLIDLPLLTEAERHQLLVDWNTTEVDYPAAACLHELFEEQAKQTPGAVAVEFEGSHLCYRELNERANRLAHYLVGLGVGPGVLVGLFVERSLTMLVGLLGILKAGGAYVPMDPGYPKERLGYILEDSKAPIVLTEESLVDELPGFAGQSICLDRDWARIASEPEEDLVTQTKPEHLAYVLFTSGSTGRPKGVALEHRAAVNFLQWARQVFTPQELAGVLFSTSVCFDLSVFEVFVTLSAGGKIILAPNVLHLPTLPAKDEVTLINTVPSAMAELLRMGAVPVSVKTVNLAGEALPDTLVEQIYATTDVDKVYNLYGPTETTTYSTYTLVRRGSPVTIGRPIANTQCYILDASRNPVPIGVTGELYIAGSGLARGYYGRPELTNERFVPNPFSEGKGGRMYRTGDMCRWLPDGNIQYLGRIDQQVKIRGFRIELGEIEDTLRQHPAVREAVVTAREDTPGDKRLVAYVVLAREPACTTDELRDYLSQKLPDYMVPSAWVGLPALPLTPNGKVDRKGLPAPDTARPEHSLGFVAPRGALEEKLARIWAELLRLEQVGVHDNFFDLGGHSLLAAKLIARIEQVLGKQVKLVTFFQAPTIKELAAILSDQNDLGQVPGVVPLHAVGSKSPFFWVGATPRYKPLSRRLTSGQPFLGLHLQPSQVSQLSLPYKLEELAACLVKTLRAVQPKGPYYLGGFCLNGVLAYEIARQLRARGENIALLLLFDAWNPADQSSARSPQASTFVPRLRFHLANLRQLELKQVPSYSLTRLRWYVDSVRGRIWKTAYGLKLYVGNGRLSDPDQIRQVAGRAYRPGPYAGRVVFFQTSKRPVGPEWSLALGWYELVAGALEVHEIPGDHESVFLGQELEYLASQMTACLLEAQAAWDGK